MKNMILYYLMINTLSNKISPTHILTKTKFGKYRLVKVKTVIPADNVKEILVNDSLNAIHVKEFVKGCSVDIRKNDDDNTALIQRDLSTSTSRLENLLEKVLYLSCISILINVIVLCIC